MLANSGDVTDIVLDLESEKKNLSLKKGMQMSTLAQMPWSSKPIHSLILFPELLLHEVYPFL